jgi:hypothetical protein
MTTIMDLEYGGIEGRVELVRGKDKITTGLERGHCRVTICMIFSHGNYKYRNLSPIRIY